MLPAVPPNSRRICGTWKQTFRLWILSGKMWFLKGSGNTMMVSKASEPHTRIDIVLPLDISKNGSFVPWRCCDRPRNPHVPSEYAAVPRASAPTQETKSLVFGGALICHVEKRGSQFNRRIWAAGCS